MSEDVISKLIVPSVMKSGFPFQMAVTSQIEETPKWRILRQEFPWRDDDGKSQFLDIVAECDGLVTTIGCKKTETNVVTFLLPTQPKQVNSGASNFVWVRRINDSTQRLAVSAADVWIPPESYEAKFAVVASDSKSSNSRLIEADIQMLLKGTIEYAIRSRSIRGLARTGPIVPILVTTAKLYVNEFDTSKVSIESMRTANPSLARIPVSV